MRSWVIKVILKVREIVGNVGKPTNAHQNFTGSLRSIDSKLFLMQDKLFILSELDE